MEIKPKPLSSIQLHQAFLSRNSWRSRVLFSLYCTQCCPCHERPKRATNSLCSALQILPSIYLCLSPQYERQYNGLRFEFFPCSSPRIRHVRHQSPFSTDNMAPSRDSKLIFRRMWTEIAKLLRFRLWVWQGWYGVWAQDCCTPYSRKWSATRGQIHIKLHGVLTTYSRCMKVVSIAGDRNRLSCDCFKVWKCDEAVRFYYDPWDECIPERSPILEMR